MHFWKNDEIIFTFKMLVKIILKINSTVDISKWKSGEKLLRKHSIYEYKK